MRIVCLLAFLSSFLPHAMRAEQLRYPLYCMYTPQFESMYRDYFLPSIKDPFDLVTKVYPEECPSGKFQSEGWNLTMLRKLEMLREAILSNWNQIFFYSDVDIVFIKPVLSVCIQYLGEKDFVVQQGWPRKKICAGFFVMRGNEKTLQLIDLAIDQMVNHGVEDDQTAMQRILTQSTVFDWDLLPSDQFPNGRRVTASGGLFAPGEEILLPDSMLLFHANCCIGLEDKYAFLDQVIKIVDGK